MLTTGSWMRRGHFNEEFLRRIPFENRLTQCATGSRFELHISEPCFAHVVATARFGLQDASC
jgi:hypothetical protein